MLVRFKHAVHLKGKNGRGKDYSRGIHEVLDEHLKDPHFQKLLKAGLVEDGEAAAKAVSPESFQDRQRKLAEKFASAPHKPMTSSPSPEFSSPSAADVVSAPAEVAAEVPAETGPLLSESEMEELGVGDSKDPSEKKSKSKKKR